MKRPRLDYPRVDYPPGHVFAPWTPAQFAVLIYNEARGQGFKYVKAIDIVADQLDEYGYRVPARRTLERWVELGKGAQVGKPRGDRMDRVQTRFQNLRKKRVSYDAAIIQIAEEFHVDERTVKRWLKRIRESAG